MDYHFFYTYPEKLDGAIIDTKHVTCNIIVIIDKDKILHWKIYLLLAT